MPDEHPPAEPIARIAYAMFADRYSALATTKPHNALYERPATLALLGDVDGLRVLDAGCGPGIASEILLRRGATVHGVDVVPEMVELARQRCSGLAGDFTVADLARPLAWIDEGAFDKVLCALGLDYIDELVPVLREFRRVARPGATLVFSMSHPMRDWTDERARGEGAYYERSRFGLHWTGFGEPHPFVEAYRRPLAEILNAVVEAGWTFDRIEEPRPLEEMRALAARTYDKLSRSPAFLCVRARR